MASSTSGFIAAVLFIVILNQSDAVSAVQRREMDSMLTALRSNGYGLFSNAIVTSDLSYDLVDGGEAAFTVFAPTDSSLFALDMVNSASDYTATLRCHVVPQRLSVRGLNRLRPGSSLRTLAADHDLRVESRRSTPSGDVISVDGVDVVAPGLFYARNIAVHGLKGILNCRSRRAHDDVLVRQPATPSRSEPPAVTQTESPSESNLTIAKSNSPVSHRFKKAPQSTNFSVDNSSMDVNPSGESFNLTPSPSIDLSNFIDPPSAAAPIDYDMAATFPPALQKHGSDSIAPSYSPPTMMYFPPEVQQAFGAWTDTSTAPYFSPVTEFEPPVPEFSENDDPTLFPPSPAITLQVNRGRRKKAFTFENGEVLRYMPLISPDDISESEGNGWESFGPSDENTADCPASDEPAQAKFTGGDLYTRQKCTPI
ncbi:unnamed protein product [Cuscuta campestris]|uniref:FAS1 domain-containing protein n=1 Tax=Cuscuta campestris TaxID=132261 RepID=A0A484LJ27_9ASTE|nr:unnamed protein product [Cuscuta campestris]